MLNNTGRIGIVFQHWSARVSKHQYRRDWALTVCGNTIFASSKHPVARYGPMTRVARVRRNTRCGVPLHSFGGHRCDRNTNPECFDARKLVAAGCPPKKCCRNTHFLQWSLLVYTLRRCVHVSSQHSRHDVWQTRPGKGDAAYPLNPPLTVTMFLFMQQQSYMFSNYSVKANICHTRHR